MPDYYYTARPESEHNERLHEMVILGRTLRFETDAGVFSKNELDPGSRLLIETAGRLTGRVLDLGCGWGPVGVSLALQNPDAEFLMTDVNERAVDLSRKNIALNGVKNARAVLSDGFAAIDGSFSHVLTNPPIRAGKALIYALFDESFRRLEPGGTLSLVIRKQQGAPSALRHIAGLFGEASVIARDAGYWIIRGEKA